MLKYVLTQSLSVLARKPIMLWGVSIMCSIITILVMISGFFVPIITIPIALTLEAGMAALYLDGYNNQPINSKQLFKGFSKECVPRVTGGMCWYYLWSIIWLLIPFVGIFIYIVKAYSYRFTPYILISRPEISATDALKVSMAETKGYKLLMFLTDLLICAAIAVIVLILTLLSDIRHIGIIFAVILSLFLVALYLFLPLFFGLIKAAFYQETRGGRRIPAYRPAPYNNPSISYGPPSTPVTPGTPTENNPSPVNNADWFCTECGTQNPAGTIFCRACGKRKD